MSPDRQIPLGFMSSGESGLIDEIKGICRSPQECPVEHPHRLFIQKRFAVLPSHGNRKQKLESRLNCMGIIPGEKIQVVRNSPPGPVIVAIKDTRLCLDRALACKIMVSNIQASRSDRPDD